ncbi:MAG: transglycosylase SLT domain-containing protein [Bauldia litoralis]
MRIHSVSILIVPLLIGAAASPSTAAAASKPSEAEISAARAIMRSVQERKWFLAQAHLRTIKDPTLRALVNWRLYQRRDGEARFADIAGFFLKHPDWPIIPASRRWYEEESKSAPAKVILSWYRRFPPITATGCSTYVSALKSTSRKEAQEAAARCWIILPMTRQEEMAFSGVHGGLLGDGVYGERIRQLLRRGRLEEAERLVKSSRDLSKSELTVIELRLQLQQRNARKNQGSIIRALRAVPAKLRNDADLLFDEIRWHRRRGAPAMVEKRLKAAPDRPVFARRWWIERSIAVHRLMRAGRWKQAYALVAAHQQWGSGSPEEPEALAGWIALRKLKDETRASLHFQRVLLFARDRRDAAMAAYWLGRTAAAERKTALATGWYRLAARETETFFGQIAQVTLKAENYSVPAPPPVSAKIKASFDNRDLVQAARLLKPLGLDYAVRPFLVRIVATSRTIDELRLAAQLAHDLDETGLSVRAARLGLRRGPVDLDLAFPRTDIPESLPVSGALVFAIIRQESEFNTKAQSTAGARGLMQLLPSTAKELARQNKIPFEAEKLTGDPAYNIQLGAALLDRLLKKYDGSIVLAVAAYNAGPARVDRWIKSHGNPNSRRVDALDWIVRIPYGETRDYVQKVLTNYLIYRSLSGATALKGGVEATWKAKPDDR